MSPAPRTLHPERIAVLTSSFPGYEGDPSGHFVHTEVEQLVAEGHPVSVLVPHGVKDLSLGARVVQLPGGSLFGWPGALPRLKANPFRIFSLPNWLMAARRELTTQPYDRVIAHWLIPSGWIAASAFHGPLEVVLHGSDVQLLRRLPLSLARKALAPLLGSGARAVPVSFRSVSASLRQEFIQLGDRCGFPSQSFAKYICVQPPALSLGAVPEKAEARRMLGLRRGDFHALCVGRLIPSKRIDRALSCHGLPPNALFTVLGDGPLLAELKARFPKVRFPGAVSRPEALLWMRAADVLITASAREGSPTTIREARALGTEVWTSEVGDVAEWALRDPGIRVLQELG